VADYYRAKFPVRRAAVTIRGQLLRALRNMNLILEVGTVFSLALVEPGVTYHDGWIFKARTDHGSHRNV
jgi:hypothetical protein